MRMMRARNAALLFGTLLWFFSGAPAQKDKTNRAKSKGSSELHIDSGELLSSSGLPIHVNKFEAVVGGDQKPEPRDNGKKTVVTIRHGVAYLTPDTITKLLSTHVGGGNIKDLSVTTAPNKVTIKGKAHKVVDVPFEIDGHVEATPDGMIKLQVGGEKAAHLPDAITKTLGFDDLSKLVGSNTRKGVQTSKNSMTFDPDLMWGLPVHGHVVRAITTSKGLLLTFGPE